MIARGVLALIGMLLCCATGCWQEISYTGPEPAVARRDASPRQEQASGTDDSPVEQRPDPMSAQSASDMQSDAASFGEDLAASFASQPATIEVPVAESSSAAAPTPDRYAMPVNRPADDLPDQLPEFDAQLPDEDELPPLGELGDVGPMPDEANAGGQPVDLFRSDAAAVKDSRLRAWQLGSQLSLAALANDRGVATENVHTWLENARANAGVLQTKIGPLPESGAAGGPLNTSRQALHYLFVQGQQIGRELSERHGADHAALVEVAIKSNLLLVLYSPGSPATDAIVGAVAQAAPRAALPARLWEPLHVLVASKADPADVRKAVQNFHAEVERHLAFAVEQ